MGNCSCNPHSENELNIETNPNLPKRNPSHFKQQPSLDQVTLNSNIDIIGKTNLLLFLLHLTYIIFFR